MLVIGKNANNNNFSEIYIFLSFIVFKKV